MRTAVGLFFILALLVVIVVVLWRRRGGDEIHSIDSYRHALDTLQEMRGPAGTASVRVLDEDEQRHLRQPPAQSQIRSSSSRPVIGAPPSARDGMVFGDDVPRDLPGDEASVSERGRHGRSDWAMARMDSRPPTDNRRVLVIGGAIVVLLLVVVGFLVAGSSHHSTSASTTTTTTAPKTTTTKPPTTTTTARPTKLVASTSTATSASYAVPSTSIVLVITATQGPCYAVVTDSSGTTKFAGAVQPGSPQRIAATGSVTVELDAPANAKVSANGIPVVFPSGYQTPLTLSFAGPSSGTTTTTAPGATTTTTTSAATTTTG